MRMYARQLLEHNRCDRRSKTHHHCDRSEHDVCIWQLRGCCCDLVHRIRAILGRWKSAAGATSQGDRRQLRGDKNRVQLCVPTWCTSVGQGDGQLGLHDFYWAQLISRSDHIRQPITQSAEEGMEFERVPPEPREGDAIISFLPLWHHVHDDIEIALLVVLIAGALVGQGDGQLGLHDFYWAQLTGWHPNYM